jgi:hypothetical protein
MPEDRPPFVPEALVLWLQELFPDRVPSDPQTPLDLIRYQQGQVSVVAKLRDQVEQQRENVLEQE